MSGIVAVLMGQMINDDIKRKNAKKKKEREEEEAEEECKECEQLSRLNRKPTKCLNHAGGNISSTCQ